jgi:branched-subunit amino acid transport protein AzlD
MRFPDDIDHWRFTMLYLGTALVAMILGMLFAYCLL